MIDWLNERRQNANKKAELIRDLGSKTNDFAQRAARELRAREWHADGTLKGAYLSGANLTGTDLSGADLTGAGLSGSDLTGANLSEANLTGAVLWGANLTDANLMIAPFMLAILTGARYDNTTKWPKEFNPKARRAINVDEQELTP